MTLCAINKTLKGISIGWNGARRAVIAYADDITILMSPEEIPKLKEILNLYTTASGASINITKSKAMAIERWDTSQTVIGISYCDQMEILDIHFTPSTNQSALKSWTTITKSE
jgi:hypothetical protein